MGCVQRHRLLGLISASPTAPFLAQSSQVVFKVKKTTKFEKILNAFCQKKAVDISQVRFVFDGTRINPSMTPEDMDMEDGDTVSWNEWIGSMQESCRHTSIAC